MSKSDKEKSNFKEQLEEKDAVIKNFDLLIEKLQKENDSLKKSIEEKDQFLKNLTLDLQEAKREKEFINSKLRFIEGMQQNENVDWNFSAETSSASTEHFDNAYRAELVSGESFDTQASICSSSVFQARNSLYPHHMRDSYAIGQIDKPISEYDMKVRAFFKK